MNTFILTTLAHILNKGLIIICTVKSMHTLEQMHHENAPLYTNIFTTDLETWVAPVLSYNSRQNVNYNVQSLLFSSFKLLFGHWLGFWLKYQYFYKFETFTQKGM